MNEHQVTTDGTADGSAAPEIHIGTCFCGSVQVRATGAPLEMGYCHCDSCRFYSAAPLVAYALFAEEQITVTEGSELLGGFNKSGMSLRRFSSHCGGHVLTEHPGMGVTDVSATIFKTCASSRNGT